jgi:RNAse (barnase) inhibitor barstar
MKKFSILLVLCLVCFSGTVMAQEAEPSRVQQFIGFLKELAAKAEAKNKEVEAEIDQYSAALEAKRTAARALLAQAEQKLRQHQLNDFVSVMNRAEEQLKVLRREGVSVVREEGAYNRLLKSAAEWICSAKEAPRIAAKRTAVRSTLTMAEWNLRNNRKHDFISVMNRAEEQLKELRRAGVSVAQEEATYERLLKIAAGYAEFPPEQKWARDRF